MQTSGQNDWFYSHPVFQEYFKGAGRSLVVKANAPHFTILAVSDEYVRITHTERDHLVNRNLSDVFPAGKPDNPEQPGMLSSFGKIIETKSADTLPFFTSETYLPGTGQMEKQYWLGVSEPVLDEGGSVAYIINTTTNITAQVLADRIKKEAGEQEAAIRHARRRNQELITTNEELTDRNRELSERNEELTRVRRYLHDLLAETGTPGGIQDHTFAESEEKLRLAMSGGSMVAWSLNPKTMTIRMSLYGKDIFGLPAVHDPTVQQFLSAIEADYRKEFLQTLQSALTQFQPIDTEFPVRNLNTGSIRWVQFTGQIFLNREGDIESCSGLMADTTEQVKMRAELARGYVREQELNEELQAINEELRSANVEMGIINEELHVTNEELQDLQTDLVTTNAKLEESEERMRMSSEAANIGTYSIEISSMKVSVSNRTREIFGLLPGEDASLENFLLVMQPPYREKVAEAIRVTIAESGVPFFEEYRIRRKSDDAVRWVRGVGNVRTAGRQQQRFFTGVIIDITEQREDDQRKNDFIGMVSHEMKTPLTSLSGYVQFLQMNRGTGTDALTADLLQRARKQVEKMTTMINSFLNVSRLESGKIEINKSRFDMAGLVSEMEEEMRSLHNMHRFVFHDAEHVQVLADREKIGQVINNLISNAVKYSTPGSAIHISCTAQENTAKLCVQDEGIGIAPGEIPKLFDRYYRVANQSTKSISGFGIGLYLCAEIIKRHDGLIWGESEEGQGSTFCFTLPVS